MAKINIELYRFIIGEYISNPNMIELNDFLGTEKNKIFQEMIDITCDKNSNFEFNKIQIDILLQIYYNNKVITKTIQDIENDFMIKNLLE